MRVSDQSDEIRQRSMFSPAQAGVLDTRDSESKVNQDDLSDDKPEDALGDFGDLVPRQRVPVYDDPDATGSGGVLIWTDDRGGVDQPAWAAMAREVVGSPAPRRAAKRAPGRRS